MNLIFNTNTLFVLCAMIPAIAWAYLFFSDDRKEYRKLFFIIFIGGTLTVLPVIWYNQLYQSHLLNYSFFQYFNNLKYATNYITWTILLYSFVSITEELSKFFIIKYADKTHPELITNINQALKFGILSGLGFAFSENILYFINIWKNTESTELILSVIFFRSIFTTFAHIAFTGIFSYFYGLSKFSKDFVEFKKWKGEKVSINEYTKIKYKNILTGLSLAIILHTVHNVLHEFSTLLTLNINGQQFNTSIILVILLIVGMFIYLNFLLSTNTGNLTFILANKHRSTMAQQDKEVVLELIGMWYKEGRYEEVKGICTRLLKRDPDNNVVKLFKAQIQDKLDHEQESSNNSGLAN